MLLSDPGDAFDTPSIFQKGYALTAPTNFRYALSTLISLMSAGNQVDQKIHHIEPTDQSSGLGPGQVNGKPGGQNGAELHEESKGAGKSAPIVINKADMNQDKKRKVKPPVNKSLEPVKGRSKGAQKPQPSSKDQQDSKYQPPKGGKKRKHGEIDEDEKLKHLEPRPKRLKKNALTNEQLAEQAQESNPADADIEKSGKAAFEKMLADAGLSRKSSRNSKARSAANEDKDSVQGDGQMPSESSAKLTPDTTKLQSAMKKRLTTHISEPLADLCPYLEKYLHQGFDNAPLEEKQAIKQIWMEQEVKKHFVTLVTSYRDASNEIAQQILKALDPVDFILLVMSEEGNYSELQLSKNALFSFVKQFFHADKLPSVAVFKDQKLPKTESASKFLCGLFDWWIETDPKLKPNWQYIYFMGLYGQLQYAFERGLEYTGGWKNVDQINLTTTKLSTKRLHTLEFDLYVATKALYPLLNPETIKVCFIESNMLMNHEVLEPLAAETLEDQHNVICLIVDWCTGVKPMGSHFNDCLVHLKKQPWLVSALSPYTPQDDPQRLGAEKFSRLIKGLSNLGKAEAQNHLKKHHEDMEKAILSLNQALDTRTHADVKQDKLKAYLAKQMESASVEFQALVNVFAEQGAELEALHSYGKFKRDPMQEYICARIVEGKAQMGIFVIPPGSGKSFILLQLALYYRRKLNKKVIILTSTVFLVEQLYSQLRGYYKSTEIAITNEALQAVPSDCIVLVDESDDWVEKNVLKCDSKGKLAGFKNLIKADKVHFLTATVSVLLQNILEELPSATQGDFIKTFESKAAVSTGGQSEFQIDNMFAPDASKMEASFVQQVVHYVDKQPIICFFEDNADAMIEQIRPKLPAGYQLTYIDTPDTAKRVRDENKTMDRGVYVLDPQFARGYDLKLSKDAAVLIMQYRNGFPLSVVKQMVGRGCRSFGQALGKYFNYHYGASHILMDILEQKEPDYKQGASQLALLYLCYDQHEAKDQKDVMVPFLGGHWVDMAYSFQMKFPHEYHLLTGGRGKPDPKRQSRQTSSQDQKKTFRSPGQGAV